MKKEIQQFIDYLEGQKMAYHKKNKPEVAKVYEAMIQQIQDARVRSKSGVMELLKDWEHEVEGSKIWRLYDYASAYEDGVQYITKFLLQK